MKVRDTKKTIFCFQFSLHNLIELMIVYTNRSTIYKTCPKFHLVSPKNCNQNVLMNQQIPAEVKKGVDKVELIRFEVEKTLYNVDCRVIIGKIKLFRSSILCKKSLYSK